MRRPISGKATRFPEIVARRQRPERVEQVPEISRRYDAVLIHPRRPSDELCSSRRSRSKARATPTRAAPFSRHTDWASIRARAASRRPSRRNAVATATTRPPRPHHYALSTAHGVSRRRDPPPRVQPTAPREVDVTVPNPHAENEPRGESRDTQHVPSLFEIRTLTSPCDSQQTLV